MTFQPARVMLTIPADPEYLRLARLAASDVGTRAGMSFEEVDDLRIAVDELSFAISGGGTAEQLTLTYTVHEREVEVEGECAGEADATPTELAQAIIAAVVDSYDIDVGDGARRFRLRKRVATVT